MTVVRVADYCGYAEHEHRVRDGIHEHFASSLDGPPHWSRCLVAAVVAALDEIAAVAPAGTRLPDGTYVAGRTPEGDYVREDGSVVLD